MSRAPKLQACLETGVNRGLPKLDLGDKPFSRHEFLPVWLVYLPVVVYWLVLSLRYRSFGLPMLANPRIFLGGMVGESKSDILSLCGDYARQYVLPWVTHRRSESGLCGQRGELVKGMSQRAIDFPCIGKPDLGCRGSGVELLASPQQLENYLSRIGVGRRMIVQRLAPWGAEAGVFYIREPGAEAGRVVSLTLKYRPTVAGDGNANVRQLIETHPRAKHLRALFASHNKHQLENVPASGEEVALGFVGSHCRGSIFIDGNSWISEALSKAIDRIMKDIPDFHFGRLDIKFDNIYSFCEGRDFCIVEINGVSSEPTHIWDPRHNIWQALKVLLNQYRVLFSIGHELRHRGHKVPSARQLILTWLKELRA